MFRTTVRDVNLFETEMDKYAAFRDLSSDGNTAGVFSCCVLYLQIKFFMQLSNSIVSHVILYSSSVAVIAITL